MKLKVMVNKYVCERCNHVWITRIPTIPKQCPKCKNIYWAIPRRNEKKK